MWELLCPGLTTLWGPGMWELVCPGLTTWWGPRVWEPPSCRKVLGESNGSAWPSNIKKLQRKEEAFQDNFLLDHAITDELRARVTERQQKDAANDRKRRTTAERKHAGWQ